MTRYYYLDIIGLRIAKMFTGSNDMPNPTLLQSNMRSGSRATISACAGPASATVVARTIRSFVIASLLLDTKNPWSSLASGSSYPSGR